MTTNYQQIKTQINSPFIRAVGLVFVPLIITLIIYWPGLKGSFLFDDYPNFEPLGSTAQTSTYTRIVNFIFTGGAGPTGRPVSLASFIINDNAWPSNAWGFKYTNLMIHLLNGLLIFWLLYKLLIITKHTEKTASVIAALTSLVWLVHPLNVSTVLYIIQRMTQLGTLFMLAGLISFIYGREFLRLEKIPAALWCLCLAYPIFGLLAIFSKEMGVSLLLYVLVLEVTVLQNTSVKKYLAGYKYWYLTFVLVPLFLVIAYLSATFAPEIYNQRDFTLGERLLTETRILLDYLSQILFPRLAHGGVYQDDYLISRSIFDPITTLFSISALLLIFILSIKYRKRYPYYCLAGLWFLGGHALESSFIALE
ncbi:MAG: tetratricopeptide repeat protein, partial [Thiohalomonadales bacterium]